VQMRSIILCNERICMYLCMHIPFSGLTCSFVDLAAALSFVFVNYNQMA